MNPGTTRIDGVYRKMPNAGFVQEACIIRIVGDPEPCMSCERPGCVCWANAEDVYTRSPIYHISECALEGLRSSWVGKGWIVIRHSHANVLGIFPPDPGRNQRFEIWVTGDERGDVLSLNRDEVSGSERGSRTASIPFEVLEAILLARKLQ